MFPAMPEDWGLHQLLPSNGLDRSLHAPVFIGLILLSFFKETLGWTYAGLVVPGYLATVFVAAPVTGVLVVLESVLTYVASVALGRWLPRTGAWFTFFGRERFLLIIAVGSFVRLFVEGAVVPRVVSELGLTHSRELYSLGLVLVPLLANSYWNAGLIRALPRVSVVTTLTYLLVTQVLLRYTNFTVSRFQVANESVSLAFLESPHAHIILLMGAVLGARNNVRYGWDYNGILVPALLAVAWYQPTKVLATVVEALVVFYLSALLIKVPPLSRLLLVGSRRLLVTFSVGFAVKYVSGFVLMRYAPQVQMIDTFGFGYLLPSLMAVKFWDKQKVLRVLMPTLQVSMVAFPLGIALGYVLRLLSPAPASVVDPRTAVVRVSSIAEALLRGDSAPAPHRSGASTRHNEVYDSALDVIGATAQGDHDLASSLAASVALTVSRSKARDWVVVAPAVDDPNRDSFGPRVAIRVQRSYGDDWGIIVDGPALASPAIAVAQRLALRLGAGVVVLRSRLPEIAPSDDQFISKLAELRGMKTWLVVSSNDRVQHDTGRLSVVGAVPRVLNHTAIETELGVSVRVAFREAVEQSSPLDNVPRLSLSANVARRAAAAELGSPELSLWADADRSEFEARLRSLVGTAPGEFSLPDPEEIRLYGALVGQRLRTSHSDPDDWQRALAGVLGLRFAAFDVAGMSGWALHEPAGAGRRGSATWLQLNNAASDESSPWIVVPAPRWERGVLAAALAVARASAAPGVLLSGAVPNATDDGSSDSRRVEGRRSFYQRALETWLNADGNLVAIRGIEGAQASATPLVVSFDAEVLATDEGPDWTHAVLGPFAALGFEAAPFDGSSERAAFSASNDPAVAYARRFSPASSMVLWIRSDIRDAFGDARSPKSLSARLGRVRLRGATMTVARASAVRRECTRSAAPTRSCETWWVQSDCDADQVLRDVQHYQTTRNPLLLGELKQRGELCGLVAVSAPDASVWFSFASLAISGRQNQYWFPLTRALSDDSPVAVSADDLMDVQWLPLKPLIVRDE